jgi:hypothetical protein
MKSVMPISIYKRLGCGLAAVALFGAASLVLPSPASAQGLLGAIFEALGGRPAYRPPVQAYADPGRRYDPLGLFTEPPRDMAPPSGPAAAYCVRTCDGRYFPIAPQANATPAELCRAMCPASKTKMFSGAGIDRAVARDGTRYADLENAFVYRDRIVDGCTCNGKNAFGLAPIDAASDPTLRQGDIVATKTGLMAYTPRRTRRGETADFTPVDQARLPRELKARLSAVEITKPQ